MVQPLLWVALAVAGSLAQILRNGAQASLSAKIGTLGATQTRFVFGLPFAALFLAVVLAFTGEVVPAIGWRTVAWTALGAACQIGGTAMMLVVMHRRAFGVAYAYIKTEPAIVALMGVALLGDRLPPLAWVAIGVVTAGVLLASTRPSEFRSLVREGWMIAGGVVSGAFYGLSAIAFRGGIEAIGDGGFVIRSMTTLVLSLMMQTAMLGGWLALRDPAAFIASLREWRGSLLAGMAGALASTFFFIAFSLTAAANVRTVALIELPLAAAVSGRLGGKGMARHELIGLAVVMGGLALLMAAHA